MSHSLKISHLFAPVWGRGGLGFVLWLVVSLHPVAVLAQDLRLRPLGTEVGSADHYGYVRVVRELGSVPVGDGRQLNLPLLFTSDPSVEPGLLGPGWRLPWFDSRVYAKDRNVLVWEAPDDRRRFFTSDEGSAAARGEQGYISQNRKWRASVDARRDTVRITGADEGTWAFEYRGGRLQRFRLGPGSHVFRVEYTARGYPLALHVEGQRDPVFQVEYAGTVTPRSLRLGGRTIGVSLGRGEMVSPDGRGDVRGPFLEALDYGDGRVERFAWIKRGTHTRADPADRAGKRMLRLPVNRMVLTDAAGGESWVEWEAQSGFITADSGAPYRVSNRDYDPHQPAPERPNRRISPGVVKIERLPEGQPAQLWERNWRAGVITRSRPDGILVRQTRIMAQGPAYGKLRKTEERKGDAWALLRILTYSSSGQLIREVDGQRNAKQFIYDDLGRKSQVVGNTGHRTEYIYLDNGNYVERLYEEGAVVEYHRDDFGRIIAKKENGSLIYRLKYDDHGRLANGDYGEMGGFRRFYEADGSYLEYVEEKGIKVVGRSIESIYNYHINSFNKHGAKEAKRTINKSEYNDKK